MSGQQIPPYDPVAVCDPAQTLPDDDLFEPTMVTIILANEGADDTTFVVLLALICGRSQYFKSAFQSQFVEAGLKKTTIDEVPVWVFKTFIKWLYTQRLTLCPSTPSAELLEAAPVCGEKRKRTSTEGEDAELDGETPAKKQQIAAGEASTSTKQVASEVKQPVAKATSNLVTLYGRSFVEEDADGSLPGNALNALDEEDLTNPITCSFRALFELYLFADKYDTFGFRKLVLEHIQLKVQITHPRQYLPPSKEDTKFVVNRLPRTDRLFKFLASLWARDVALSPSCESRAEAASLLEEFPGSFLAACLLEAKSFNQAMQCQNNDRCNGIDHSTADLATTLGALECSFHEHGGAEDRKRCDEKWVKLAQWCQPVWEDEDD